MKFKSVEPNYTGGGIYVFTGQVDDNYFVADSPNFDVRLLNDDPNAEAEEDWFDTNVESVEWQEEHLVKDLTEWAACAEFFAEMLKWVKENKPDGNYLMGDMEDIAKEMKLLLEEWL